MTLHRFGLVAITLALPPILALRASPDYTRVRTYTAPCMTDTVVRNQVLHTIKHVLNAPLSDTLMAERRDALTVSGIPWSQVMEVQDSATCEAARVAYPGLVYPDIADTAKRRNFFETLPEVMVVRLSPNRLVLATDIADPLFVFEMFIVDSTFALVHKGF